MAWAVLGGSHEHHANGGVEIFGRKELFKSSLHAYYRKPVLGFLDTLKLSTNINHNKIKLHNKHIVM